MLDAVTPVDVSGGVVEAALEGLGKPQKTLPAKLFYDLEGCRLFDAITRLPEYYVTRTERTLLEEIAADLGRDAPADAVLVEYGASREDKARVLLERMRTPRAYVPIDVAAPALDMIAARMAGEPFAVIPVAADFTQPLVLPAALSGAPKLGFFPGSTIGNFEPSEAGRFLESARGTMGEGAFFLVGVDLRKEASVLLPAYDDAAGVTAAFNLNLLARLNREASADFDLSRFAHEARWNERDSRIEMHLVSLSDQVVPVAGQQISFKCGESIHTENSYKHTVAGFQDIAANAGWRPVWVRTDAGSLFSLHLLCADGQP